jgi:DNA repair protein REV1
VNGYTQPSLNDLHGLIVQYGGVFSQYLDGKTSVTHIIAANLTPKKRVEFRRYRIVKPAWVVDSIEAGQLLPWDNYRVIDEGKTQKVLGIEKGQVINKAASTQRGYRDQTDRSWYTEQFEKYEAETGKSEDRLSSRSSQDIHSPAQPEKNDDEAPEFDLTKSFEDYLATETNNDGQDTVASDIDETVYEARSPVPESHSSPDDMYGMDENFEQAFSEASPIKSDAPKGAKLSAEEHNRALLSDPKIREMSCLNPRFLQQFYSASRLHHLSAWKADLKDQLQNMAAEQTKSQKLARPKRAPGSRRYILHVDFDCFFAAITLKKYPHLVDQPVAIAHSGKGNAEIASCNYPAREFGVKNGMWMKKAQQLCPKLKVLPYDFDAYEEASRQFYKVIIESGGVVQSVSIDEALLDASETCIDAGGSDGRGVHEGNIWREQDRAEEIGVGIRHRIRVLTGCEVSVGIGGNILLAKLALRKAKPAGQYHIKPEEVLDFIGTLPVESLPGVAWSIGGKLDLAGVKLVKDVRETSKEKLILILGPKTGEKMWEYSRGIDRTEVGDTVQRKSVSAEVNWGIRFEEQTQAEEFFFRLAGELHDRLVKERVKGRNFTLKIMKRSADAPLDPPKHMGHGKCDDFSKSIILGVSTNSQEVIYREAVSILRSFRISPGELRGIGMQMTKLELAKEGADASQKMIKFDTKVKVTTDDDIPSPDDSVKLQHREITQTASKNPNVTNKPLNIMGTQFVMPSQIDPAVLAELPEDIRSRLKAQRRNSPSPQPKRSNSSVTNQSQLSLSQLDPETLAALPPDVRAEVLASFKRSPIKPPAQSLLPQSPRKPQSFFRGPKKPSTPSKKRTVLFTGVRNPGLGNSSSTLTQSNFIGGASKSKSEALLKDDVDSGPDIDPDYLAALPEDIRVEVLAAQRAERLRASRLSVVASKRNKQPVIQPQERLLHLPPLPKCPTFSEKRLSDPEKLRSVIKEWWREFAVAGPDNDDVRAFSRYISRVVSEERNMEKAVRLVKWVDYVVEDWEDLFSDIPVTTREIYEKEGKERWRGAVEKLKDTIQEVVRERGLGRLADFD